MSSEYASPARTETSLIISRIARDSSTTLGMTKGHGRAPRNHPECKPGKRIRRTRERPANQISMSFSGKTVTLRPGQQVCRVLRRDGAVSIGFLFAYRSLEDRSVGSSYCVVLSQNASIATSTLDDKTFVSKRGCGYVIKGRVIGVVVRFKKDYVR